ncbi:MAG: hypothetical protein AB2L22_03790 [Syntrophales bacterium]
MPKLNTRQIVILAIMAVAILYAAYEILGPRLGMKGPAKKAATTADVQKFVAETSAGLAAQASGELEVYAAVRAETPWGRDPFMDRGAYIEYAALQEGILKNKAAASGKAITFAYTGYLEAGKRRVAIINGVEYNAGEPLVEEGYVLRAVDKSKVVIEKKLEGVKFDVLIQE